MSTDGLAEFLAARLDAAITCARSLHLPRTGWLWWLLPVGLYLLFAWLLLHEMATVSCMACNFPGG